MKILLVVCLLATCLTSQAQTSSTYRNRIIQQTNAYLDHAEKYCEEHAEKEYRANTGLLDPYKGKYLNDCLHTFKMTLMKRHQRSLLSRIKFLEGRLGARNTSELRGDINGLKLGLQKYRERYQEEKALFVRSSYRRRSLKETPVDLKRHINQLGLEYFELMAEMKAEGSK